MREVIFWGATGQAKVLRECLRHDACQLMALFDSNPDQRSPFTNIPCYTGKAGFEEWLRTKPHRGIYFAIAIGGSKGKDRLNIQHYLLEQGLLALSITHPTAFVAPDARIGTGCQILANASVGVDSVLSDGCIINTNAVVDHECQLGQACIFVPVLRLLAALPWAITSWSGPGP